MTEAERARSPVENLAADPLDEYRRLMPPLYSRCMAILEGRAADLQAAGEPLAVEGDPVASALHELTPYARGDTPERRLLAALMARASDVDDGRPRQDLPPVTFRSLAKESRYAGLGSELESWASDHGLGAEWCLDLALRTLAMWVLYSAALEAREWNAVGLSHRVIPKPRKVEIEVGQHHPHSGESWEDFERGFRAAAAAWVDDHIAEERSRHREAILVGNPIAREAHIFEQLARRQVLGSSYSEIASATNSSKQNVQRNCRRLADRLGLPLRK